jgi:hypothetical protein
MAPRENTAIQFALILFVFITIALSAATVHYFGKHEEQVVKRHDVETAIKTLKQEKAELQQDRETLKLIIGAYTDDVSLDTISGNHETDVREVMPGEAFDTSPYRVLVARLAQICRAIGKREAAGLKREAKQAERLEHERKQHVAIVALHTADRKRLQQDLVAVRASHHQERRRYVALWDELARKLDEKGRQLAEWEIRNMETQRNLERQIAQWKNRYAGLREKWETVQPDKFEAPHGKLAAVRGREQIVIVDLGEADHLRKGLVFQVYDRDTTNVMTASVKGEIEIARTLNEHEAEARILDEDFKDPLLPGDKIFTPIWQPGRMRHFALAGVLDVNGDGKCDADKVRNLIIDAGGTVDAAVDENGRRTGEVTVETRYIIVGRRPPAVASLGGDPKTMENLMAEAKEFGVDQISVGRFCDLVGYRPVVVKK